MKVFKVVGIVPHSFAPAEQRGTKARRYEEKLFFIWENATRSLWLCVFVLALGVMKPSPERRPPCSFRYFSNSPRNFLMMLRNGMEQAAEKRRWSCLPCCQRLPASGPVPSPWLSRDDFSRSADPPRPFLPGRGALAARLVGVKMGQALQDFHHVGMLVQNRHAASPEHGAVVVHVFVAESDSLAFLGGQNRARGTPGKTAFKAPPLFPSRMFQ